MAYLIGRYIKQQLWGFLLWSYGWKRDRYLRLGKPVVRWQDPLSMLWYSEDPALKLLKIQVIDQLNQK